MIVIPEIALDPDIKGVCNVGGTLVMTSNPTKIARMKIVSAVTKISIESISLYRSITVLSSFILLQ
jgi:hypothetical protein